MYCLILMAALGAGTNTPTTFWSHGCYGGCHGGCYGYASYGYGCYGCAGCWGGAWGRPVGGFYDGACYGYPSGWAPWSGGVRTWGYYGYWPYSPSTPLWGTCFGCHGCYGCYGCFGCYGGWGNGMNLAPYHGYPVIENAQPAPAAKSEIKSSTLASPTVKATVASAGSNRARIIVEVPADANVYIDDMPTKTANKTFRSFLTPELEPGKDYYYILKAEVIRDNKPIVDTQRVVVRAGKEVKMALIPAAGEMNRTATASRQ